MDELICLDCGNIFYECEAKRFDEAISTPVGTDHKTRLLCPCCGSWDIEGASHCEICGGAFQGEELIGGYVCPDCLKEAMTKDNLDEFMKDDLVKESFAEFLHEKGREKRSGAGS